MKFNKKSRLFYREHKKRVLSPKINFNLKENNFFYIFIIIGLSLSILFPVYAKSNFKEKEVKIAKNYNKVKVKTYKKKPPVKKKEVIKKKEEVKKELKPKKEKIYKVTKKKKKKRKKKIERRIIKKKIIKKEVVKKDIVKETNNKPKEVIKKQNVWGLDKNSFAKGPGGLSVKAGNMLDKEYDETIVAPDEIPEAKEEIKEEYNEDEVTTAPRFIKRVAPKYTEDALEDEIEGVVILSAVISKKGKIMSVKTKKTPGYDLEKEAIKALRLSKLSPAKFNDKNVNCIMEFRYRFKIRFN